jgi:hypothetical protein
VRPLEFADFDWAGNQLLVRQAKTGHRVQLTQTAHPGRHADKPGCPDMGAEPR